MTMPNNMPIPVIAQPPASAAIAAKPSHSAVMTMPNNMPVPVIAQPPASAAIASQLAVSSLVLSPFNIWYLSVLERMNRAKFDGNDAQQPSASAAIAAQPSPAAAVHLANEVPGSKRQREASPPPPRAEATPAYAPVAADPKMLERQEKNRLAARRSLKKKANRASEQDERINALIAMNTKRDHSIKDFLTKYVTHTDRWVKTMWREARNRAAAEKAKGARSRAAAKKANDARAKDDRITALLAVVSARDNTIRVMESRNAQFRDMMDEACRSGTSARAVCDKQLDV
jgi:hypothetical protein